MTSSSAIPSSAAQPLLTATQLGQLLRAARKQRGLTQADVGARLGLSQNRVSHLEGHADELSVKQLLTWCAVVGLELSLAQRLAMRPEPGASQAPGYAVTTPPEW
ncbi:MAG: helix-turn-helix domain-containing protein [Rubrivivax sp.]|jgi:HTH-type transcriptional regulator/antitoxin HipB|nr:helix-turn-helix domain-containing protein [Rubrivivax sp.]